MISFCDLLDKTVVMENTSKIDRGEEGGDYKEIRGSFLGRETVSNCHTVTVVTGIYICVKIYRTLYQRELVLPN